jgi:hypothetical protein
MWCTLSVLAAAARGLIFTQAGSYGLIHLVVLAAAEAAEQQLPIPFLQPRLVPLPCPLGPVALVDRERITEYGELHQVILVKRVVIPYFHGMVIVLLPVVV